MNPDSCFSYCLQPFSFPINSCVWLRFEGTCLDLTYCIWSISIYFLLEYNTRQSYQRQTLMYYAAIVCTTLAVLIRVRAQSYECQCSCCLGPSCIPKQMNISQIQQCTDISCLAACKARYYQCHASPLNGQARGICKTTTTTTTTTRSTSLVGLHTCRCDCCHTGSYLCIPTNVGYTNAFACHAGACSIACSRQYAFECVNNQYGQTQGICMSSSSSTSAIIPGSFRCGCSCRDSNEHHTYEVFTSLGCSSCLQACQSIQVSCYNHQTTYCTT
jgi:hypothetical protein